MKLFFDARYIRTDFHNGISRYSAELGSALHALAPVTFLISEEGQRAHLPEGADCLLIHAPTSAKEPFTALILNRYRPDVVFSPMQTMGTFGRRFRLILTLHDMIYYRHRTPPSEFSPLIRLGWRLFHASYVPQRITLNSADVVATVSETTAADFRAVKLTKRPIIVTPNAPQRLDRYLDAPVDLSAPPRNLIYMGAFIGYKNVETLILGMADLPEHTLHLLSRITTKRKAELEALVPAGARVVFHGGVSDERYAQLLADDALLVTASLDEGYGLPIAEALTLGVPAVVSDLPIFHEVADGGARYFAATNPAAFAREVRALDDADERRRVSAAGLAHSATFSWADSARVLLTAATELATR